MLHTRTRICTCTGQRLPCLGGGRRVRTRAARRARRLLGSRRSRHRGAAPRRARLHEAHAGAARLRRILRRGAPAARGWLERQGGREGRQQGQAADEIAAQRFGFGRVCNVAPHRPRFTMWMSSARTRDMSLSL
eukprot:scaffold104137_cov87-Phaeocystis_antarctica.AAC.5